VTSKILTSCKPKKKSSAPSQLDKKLIESPLVNQNKYQTIIKNVFK
jgi:hypothetical protein